LVKPGLGKTLVVDELAATGDTLLKTKKLLEAMGIRNPKAAVLSIAEHTTDNEAARLAPGAVDYAANPRGQPVLPGRGRKESLRYIESWWRMGRQDLAHDVYARPQAEYRNLLRLLGIGPRKQRKAFEEA